MKRLYIAIALIILGLSVGFFEMYSINNTVSECSSSFDKIDVLISKNKNYDAAKLCRNTAIGFEASSQNLLYNYFNHSELDSISRNIYKMNEYLKCDEMSHYNALKIETKKQLQSLKDEELLMPHNIF